MSEQMQMHGMDVIRRQELQDEADWQAFIKDFYHPQTRTGEWVKTNACSYSRKLSQTETDKPEEQQ